MIIGDEVKADLLVVQDQMAGAWRQLQDAKAARNRPKEQVARTYMDLLLERFLRLQTTRKGRLIEEGPGVDEP